MAIIDTGDYLAEFGENLETYLRDNLAVIRFKGRDPDVKHDFTREDDVPPCIRIAVPRCTREIVDGIPVLRIRARLIFTGQDINDQAKEVESWGIKIARLASGDRTGQKNYWQTDGYMIRVYYEDVDLFLTQRESGSIEVSGAVELIGEKAI